MTLNKLNLDWNNSPLKRSRKDAIPESAGVYLISGAMPFDLRQDYFNFKNSFICGYFCNKSSEEVYQPLQG
jgi:hypothetical protein